MAEGNGRRILDIDVTDEHAFRAGVIQHLQNISDQTSVIPDLKKKIDEHDEVIRAVPDFVELVNKHEAIVQAGKWLSLPFVAATHLAVKQFLAKIGW
jgi:hypothetical protein